MGPN
jgi:hypothetical protein